MTIKKLNEQGSENIVGRFYQTLAILLLHKVFQRIPNYLENHI